MHESITKDRELSFMTELVGFEHHEDLGKTTAVKLEVCSFGFRQGKQGRLQFIG